MLTIVGHGAYIRNTRSHATDGRAGERAANGVRYPRIPAGPLSGEPQNARAGIDPRQGIRGVLVGVAPARTKIILDRRKPQRPVVGTRRSIPFLAGQRDS